MVEEGEGGKKGKGGGREEEGEERRKGKGGEGGRKEESSVPCTNPGNHKTRVFS